MSLSKCAYCKHSTDKHLLEVSRVYLALNIGCRASKQEEIFKASVDVDGT